MASYRQKHGDAKAPPLTQSPLPPFVAFVLISACSQSRVWFRDGPRASAIPSPREPEARKPKASTAQGLFTGVLLQIAKEASLNSGSGGSRLEFAGESRAQGRLLVVREIRRNQFEPGQRLRSVDDLILH